MQFRRARFLYRFDQFLRRELGESFELQHIAFLERKNIVKILDETVVEQEIDGLFAQTFDIEGTFVGKIVETPALNCKGVAIDAAPRRLPRNALDGAIAPALGNLRGPFKWL